MNSAIGYSEGAEVPEDKTESDDDVIIWGVQEKTEIGGFYMIGKRKSEQAGCIAYVCALDDARKICSLLNESLKNKPI